jgi:hypothetical protein
MRFSRTLSVALTILVTSIPCGLAQAQNWRDLAHFNLANKGDAAAAARPDGNPATPAERLRAACSHLIVCAVFQHEVSDPKELTHAAGPYLNLDSGVGIGFRF